MTRRYEGGVIVGEPDVPTTTLEQWIKSEIRFACDSLNVVISSPDQLKQNASLYGRISALEEVLYQAKLRDLTL